MHFHDAYEVLRKCLHSTCLTYTFSGCAISIRVMRFMSHDRQTCCVYYTFANILHLKDACTVACTVYDKKHFQFGTVSHHLPFAIVPFDFCSISIPQSHVVYTCNE